MATPTALALIAQASVAVQAAAAAAAQATAAGDFLALTKAAGDAELAVSPASLAVLETAVAAAQAQADLANAIAANADAATVTNLTTASALALQASLQAEAALLPVEAMANQAAAPLKAMAKANPALGAALDANPALLTMNAQQLQMKAAIRQAAAAVKTTAVAADRAMAAVATAADPAAAKAVAVQAAAQAVTAQTGLLAAEQAMANALPGFLAAEAAALAQAIAVQNGAAAVLGAAGGVDLGAAGGAVTGAADPVVGDAAGLANGFGALTDVPTVWNGTELHQAFSFNLSDLSLMAYKALGGETRALSGLANNTIGSQQDRSREAIGNVAADATVTAAEIGSGSDIFVRITDVNNYPGVGDISQGLDGVPVAGRIQIEGPDGTPLPNERVVSNALIDQAHSDIPQSGGWNNLFMGGGQYIDHGLGLLNKGGQGSFKIPLPQDDELYGRVRGNELQMLPRGTSLDTTPGQGTYLNTVTASIDQNQLYGSDAVLHGFLREKTSDGMMTAHMLVNQWSAPSADGTDGLPTFYDVLINNGADQAALDAVLNNPAYQAAHAALSAWDAKVRAGDPSVTGNPGTDGMGQYLGMIASSKQALIKAAGSAWVDPGTALPGSSQQLLGDASHLANFDAISLAEHRIAGDLRVNENPQLTAFHTAFANFHNNTVDAILAALDQLPADAASTPGLEQLAALKANLNSEAGQQAVFDMARTVLNAGYQRMVYDQYLVGLAGGIPFGITASQDASLMPDPSKLTPQPLTVNEHGFNGWQPEVRPSVALEFSTSGFRVGHSQVNEYLNGLRVDTLQQVTTLNDTVTQSLIQSFINPDALDQLGGAAGVLAANAMEHSQAVDTWMVNAVRNMLVGRPNDLGSFNLARNNELGLPSLNEFRQTISNLYQTTGVGNALGSQASDVSAGLIATDGFTNLFLERMKPYQTWKEFGDNLRDASQLDEFMQLYGGEGAAVDNNIGLINVPLWLGGLAEKAVTTPTADGNLPSLMGSTFTFMVQESFDRAQDFDRWYYKLDLAGTDILKQLSFQTFTPMLQTALGKAAQFIHQDTFRTFQIDSLAADTTVFTAMADVRDVNGRSLNRLILANGLTNQILGSVGSDDIRAGEGNDLVDANKGADWIYGQAGDDSLYGGNDKDLDHLFGGDGDDLLVADNGSEDALFGEKGNDWLVRQNTGGLSDGGLGDDVLLGGKGNDLLDGDSGAPDASNPDGDDLIFGGGGDDVINGGGGDDLLVGGDSGAAGDVIVGDAMADANAELLARALRDDSGRIVSTLLPLFTGLGYSVTVGGVNPITGQLFSEQELDEFRSYIESLRKTPDINNPADRGPQPVMVVMPYTGEAGDDTIYTGSMGGARQLLLQACAGDLRLMAQVQGNDQLDAPTSATPETDGVTTDTAAQELAQEQQEAAALNGTDPDPKLGLARLRVAALNAGPREDKVFSGGGNDTIHTDGRVSTQVFAGAGYDVLDASLRDQAEFIHVAKLGPTGAEGLVVDANGIADQFYGVEQVVLSEAGQNSLTVSSDAGPVLVDFNTAMSGRDVVISRIDAPDAQLVLSGVDQYLLSGSIGDRIRLGGKLDADGLLDADRSDDNYQISWNGSILTINGRSTGAASFEGAEWIEFSYQDTNNPSAGIRNQFYYKEFAEKALSLGLDLVSSPDPGAEGLNEILIRPLVGEPDLDGQYYLALTAESLRDYAISTMDVTVDLGSAFADLFVIDPDRVVIADDLAVQRSVQLIQDGDGQRLRFTGAGLEGLGQGRAIGEKTVLAYVGLTLADGVADTIKQHRIADEYGQINRDTFSVPLHFAVDANVDNVVWEDLFSLRDLGGSYAIDTLDLAVTARAAQAALHTDGRFDLGTQRTIVKPGEGGATNLVRSGDTILQASHWQNGGEFSLTDLRLTAVDDGSFDAAAEVTAWFASNGSAELAELGWGDAADAATTVDVMAAFRIVGAAGSVVDTSRVGYALSANGDYSWNTTEMDQFKVKNLVTFQSDVNYDGAVTMKDLAALNAGALAGGDPHDVDVNYDGSIDLLDLSVLDAEWGQSLHAGDGTFLGSGPEADSSWISMEELFQQGGHSWDSSGFAGQNAIESGALAEQSGGAERGYTPVLRLDDPGLLTAPASADALEAENMEAELLAAMAV